jgi:glycerate kinase
MVQLLEENLRHWATLCGGDPDLPGSGAAGGAGFMLRTLLKAEITSGAELVISACGLDRALKNADLLITGEGCSDEQTACGKLPAAAGAHAAKYGVPAILCSGAIASGSEVLEKIFDGVFSISNGALSLEEAITNTAQNLHRTAAALAGVVSAFAEKNK